jgi:hypothetical protein
MKFLSALWRASADSLSTFSAFSVTFEQFHNDQLAALVDGPARVVLVRKIVINIAAVALFHWR